MNFSDFFIGRPRFAAVLSIIIFVAGLIALPILPIGEYPEVVPPTVVVRTTYAGADTNVIVVGKEIFADIPNFTKAQAVVQINDIVF